MPEPEKTSRLHRVVFCFEDAEVARKFHAAGLARSKNKCFECGSELKNLARHAVRVSLYQPEDRKHTKSKTKQSTI